MPRQRSDAIKLIEVRNGTIAINGETLTANLHTSALAAIGSLCVPFGSGPSHPIR